MSQPRALIIVDVQPTFCEGGELPVQGGDAVAAGIAAYLRARRADYDVIVTSQDWHIDPADHFSEDPDFVDTWPPHGLAGTANAELHPALVPALLDSDRTIRKGQHAAAYSAFDGTDEAGQSLQSILTGAGVTAVDVCGIAESHCVRATSLDA